MISYDQSEYNIYEIVTVSIVGELGCNLIEQGF